MAKTNDSKGSKKTRQRSHETEKQSSESIQHGHGGGERSATEISRGQASESVTPFGFLRRFGEEMERVFGGVSFGGGSLADRFTSIGSGMWSPQVEIFERNNDLVVRADLPGMTRDDISVDVTGDSLVIRGERKDEREEEDEGYYRSERSYGTFYRRITLPEGANADNAQAEFRNGVLEIKMPIQQRAEQRQRQLQIREAIEGEQPRSKAKAAGQVI
jgi:HSP20 family protein